MKISIPAGAAVLHAASTLTGQSVITRAGALLSFEVDDLDLNDTIGALKAVDDTIMEAILATENEAEIAGLTDLKRAVLGMERDIRHYFQAIAAAGAEPSSIDAGSHPRPTGDATISIAPQQSSDAENEEIDNEPSQPQPQQQPAPRRRRG